MVNFVEVNFLNVESKKSGGAITLRRQLGVEMFIRVVDGGFRASGDSVVERHARKSVARTSVHRGARVIATEGNPVSWWPPAQQRSGWAPTAPIPYPENQESN